MIETDIRVGIRKIRKEKNLTLKQISGLTGLSVGFLSQVELGTSSLAISSLKKIADALETPITNFFQPSENATYVVTKAEHTPFKFGGSPANYVRLSGQFPSMTFEPMIVTLAPGATDRLFKHSGEEFHYVLEGQLEFDINDKTYTLNPGDSIHFPATETHTWRNRTNQETKIITVVTPKIF